MGEISLRHIPDLSDASAVGNFSDASFQIPRATSNADDLLLADDTMDFLNGVNDTLSTPAPPSIPAVQPPLTLAELTPRSKPMRAAPLRSSLRPRPGVATPYRAVVANELSTALSEDLSPFRNQDPSFQIPPPPADGEDLLMAVDDAPFLEEQGATLECFVPRTSSPLTLSQLTPGPSKRIRPSPSVSPREPPRRSSIPQSFDSVPANDTSTIERLEGITAVTASCTIDTAATTSQPVPVSALKGDQSPVEQPADKGKVKELPRNKLTERQKKVAGGDKAKRKRATPAAAVTKPAKLKPLTASLARKVSNAGSKPVPGVRRRPLQGQREVTSTTSASIQRIESAARPAGPAVPANVKSIGTGGLAETLMSFGRQLMANAASPEHHGEASVESGAASATVPEATAPAPMALDCPSDAGPDTYHVEERDAEPSYLSLSQLSPRRPRDRGAEPSATLAPGSPSARETPESVFHQPAAEPQVSEANCAPSPMNHSIKRAGSPAFEPSEHQRKRSKTTSGQSAPNASKECASRKPALLPSRARNVPAAASAAGAGRARRAVSASASGANLRAKADNPQKPALTHLRPLSRHGPGGEADVTKKTKGPGRDQVLDGDSGAQLLAISEGGRSGDASDSQRENIPRTEQRQTFVHHDGQGFSRPASTVDRPPLNLPSAKPTRPVEFQFATSTRIEGRRVELEKSGSSSGSGGSSNGASLRRSKAHAAHPIPDFKALHAMQQSVLAQRKAEIVPVVPLPIELSTEARAREREKFEEARRAREAELERQREERRRQQELEEEREIKELRKRAVPKANEVPEWYAFAPKKSKAGTGN
ncbi:hypothetical protein BV20DRAFT_431524 [Pilatotrama ljubarskyi]|nr:hypothetical protein BV20DRAFT_431524 [Pilatotrama ljubarskyi]